MYFLYQEFMKVIPLKKAEQRSHQNNTSQSKDIFVSSIEKFVPNTIEMVCRVTTKNTLKFFNSDFLSISGYTETELLNQEYSKISHPEMPKLIQLIIKNSLDNNKEIIAIVKNRTKQGDYFWTLSSFLPNDNPTNLQIAYTTKSVSLPYSAKRKIDQLYSKLLQIENHIDVVTASKYLIGFLEEKGYTYSQYVASLLKE